VLVGRGVRSERALAPDGSPMSAAAETTPPPQPMSAPPATPAGSDPRAAAPPPAVDDLSYFNRLETKTPPKEQLKASAEKAAAEKPAPEKPAPEKPAPVEKPAAPAHVPALAPPPPPAAPAPAPAPAATVGSAAAEPGGAGFAVQIAALNVRGDAEAIAKRLNAKGYAAYVLTPTDGPAVYRVRVGKFPTRREAE